MNTCNPCWDRGAAAPLARLSYIELDRIEGMPCSWKATTFAGANRTLRDWAESAPSNGGYDKVRVRLVWANNVDYTYRLDLKHPSSGEHPDIEENLRHTVGFALGRITNPGWSADQHARVLARYDNQGVVALARQLDSSCMFGDVEATQRHAATSDPLREGTMEGAERFLGLEDCLREGRS